MMRHAQLSSKAYGMRKYKEMSIAQPHCVTRLLDCLAHTPLIVLYPAQPA